MSCKTEAGDALKGAACGGVGGFDPIAQSRIKRLTGCTAADGAQGKLSVIFNLDFPGNRINVNVGGASTVPNTESIGACLRASVQGISLAAIEHDNPKVSIHYTATLAPHDSASAATPGAAPSTSPDAPMSQVVWEVAIVRDTPKTGQVVGRLQRGTKVRVGMMQDGWYRVRYGSGFTSEGWVYRGSIGK
jgi:hypothetical protein